MENDPKLRKWIKFAKNFLFTFCVLSLVISCFIIAIALYLRYEWDIKNYIIELEAFIIWTGPYILIASSSLTIALSILGCYATVAGKSNHLLTFIVGTVVAAALTLSGVACALNYGTLFSDVTPWLAERFTKYIFEADTNPRYARIIRMIQEEVGCCGGTDWQDYTDNNIPLPNECRDLVTGNVYEDTCDIALSRFFQPFVGWMSGLGLLLIVLQILAVMAAILLRKSVRETRILDKISYNSVRHRPAQRHL